MESTIKVGDKVKTPRFLTVTIAEVFEDEKTAIRNGFTEPTHYENPFYYILGKHTGLNLMIFAAAKK